MKKRKMVFFEEHEEELLGFSEEKGNFSEYVKQLIKADKVNNSLKRKPKPSIYEIYEAKQGH